MTNEELSRLIQEVETALEKATPGPWKADVWYGTDDGGWRAVGPWHHQDEDEDTDEPGSRPHQGAEVDAEAIVTLRNNAPALISALKSQAEHINHLEKERWRLEQRLNTPEIVEWRQRAREAEQREARLREASKRVVAEAYRHGAVLAGTEEINALYQACKEAALSETTQEESELAPFISEDDVLEHPASKELRDLRKQVKRYQAVPVWWCERNQRPYKDRTGSGMESHHTGSPCCVPLYRYLPQEKGE